MSDIFRKEYKEINQETKDHIWMLKTLAQELMNEFECLALKNSVDGRAMAIAKTNLEQAIMWAVKAIT